MTIQHEQALATLDTHPRVEPMYCLDCPAWFVHHASGSDHDTLVYDDSCTWATVTFHSIEGDSEWTENDRTFDSFADALAYINTLTGE